MTVSTPEDQRLHAHRGLQHHHQPALVDAVGDHAAVGAEQQHRQRLQRDHDAERRRASPSASARARTARPSASRCRSARSPGRRCSGGSSGPRARRTSSCRRRSGAASSPAALPACCSLPSRPTWAVLAFRFVARVHSIRPRPGQAARRAPPTPAAPPTAPPSALLEASTCAPSAAVRSRWIRSRIRRPAAVARTSAARRSPGLASRLISPASHSCAVIRESIVGFTLSISATSPSPSGPEPHDREQHRGLRRRQLRARARRPQAPAEPADHGAQARGPVGVGLRERGGWCLFHSCLLASILSGPGRVRMAPCAGIVSARGIPTGTPVHS